MIYSTNRTASLSDDITVDVNESVLNSGNSGYYCIYNKR